MLAKGVRAEGVFGVTALKLQPDQDQGEGERSAVPALVAPALTPVELCDLIAAAPRSKPYVVAQLGQSLDGRIATLTGESRWINRGSSLDHLHRLRACVDAVVVGVGTIIADDPLLTVRRASGRNPARVVIDPFGRLPVNSRFFNDDGAERIVVRASQAPVPSGAKVVRLQADGRHMCPAAIVSALFALDYRRLLIEGGAATISAFIDAGVVDRLHVMVAPMILGSGKPGLSLLPITELAKARRPCTTVHLLPDGDVLFDCDLRSCS